MTTPVVLEVEVSSHAVQLEVQTPQAVVTPDPLPQVIYAATPGPIGPRGLPGTGVPIVGEQLTGTLNGVNLIFTTVHNYQPNSTAVFLNGLREARSIGYSESGVNEIAFTSAPLAGDDIRIDYVVS